MSFGMPLINPVRIRTAIGICQAMLTKITPVSESISPKFCIKINSGIIYT